MSSELEVVAVDGTRQLITLERHPHVLRELAVQVVPVAGSIRIEPIQRGALLQIDGEEVLCKQLCAGEFVTIGGVRLRCVRITESPPKSMPAGSSTPTQPQGRVQTVPIGEERQRLTKRAGASSRQPAQKPTRTRQRLQRKSSWLPASAITAARSYIWTSANRVSGKRPPREHGPRSRITTATFTSLPTSTVTGQTIGCG